jgi:hypothetical protein
MKNLEHETRRVITEITEIVRKRWKEEKEKQRQQRNDGDAHGKHYREDGEQERLRLGK